MSLKYFHLTFIFFLATGWLKCAIILYICKFLLVIHEFWTLCFDHVHSPLTNSFISFPHLPNTVSSPAPTSRPICDAQTFLNVSSSPWSMLSLPGAMLLETTVSHSAGSSNASGVPRLGVELCAHSVLHAGVWSGLGLHRSCTCCHKHCEFTCAAALLCLWHTVS